jgi:hypothetical protein
MKRSRSVRAAHTAKYAKEVRLVSPVGCVRRGQNLGKHEKSISVVTHQNIPVTSYTIPHLIASDDDCVSVNFLMPF